MNRSQIYTNATSRKVFLEVPVLPVPGTLTVKIFEAGTEVHEVSTIVAEPTGLSFALPFFLTQSDGEFEVRWAFDYVENNETYTYEASTFVEVATPIIPLSVVKDMLGQDYDSDDVVNIEQSVRHIIQAHTGQTFGRFVGTKSVVGRGDNFLHLPARLLSLSTLNGLSRTADSVAVSNNGWSINARSYYGVPSIKADDHGVNEYTYLYPPVSFPSTHRFAFRAGWSYDVDGVWGWNFVPAAVQEAAALLIHDYACADAVYRDRFISSMTAADWRIQFHDGAFTNTGNVRANQLLADFIVKHGWVVF